MGERDPSATLEAIRDRAGVVAKLGPPRPGGDLINAAHRSAADVPRLLAALEAVLKLADDWMNTPWPEDGGDRAGVATEQIILDGTSLREAITRALNGDTDA